MPRLLTKGEIIYYVTTGGQQCFRMYFEKGGELTRQNVRSNEIPCRRT